MESAGLLASAEEALLALKDSRPPACKASSPAEVRALTWSAGCPWVTVAYRWWPA